MENLHQLIEIMAKSLVDNPDDVEVKDFEEDDITVF